MHFRAFLRKSTNNPLSIRQGNKLRSNENIKKKVGPSTKKKPFGHSHSLQRTYWPSELQLIIPSSCSFIGISPSDRGRLPSSNLFFADTTGIIAAEIIMAGKSGFSGKKCKDP